MRKWLLNLIADALLKVDWDPIIDRFISRLFEDSNMKPSAKGRRLLQKIKAGVARLD